MSKQIAKQPAYTGLAMVEDIDGTRYLISFMAGDNHQKILANAEAFYGSRMAKVLKAD
jgi:hypothetical protein